MSAVREVHRQDRVAVIDRREVDRHVRLSAGVGLNVGAVAAEELEQPRDRQSLSDIDELAAAVVAPAGIAFGVFVGEDGALGGHDRGAGIVFRRDHLQSVLLAAHFVRDGLVDFGIGGFQNVHERPRPGLSDMDIIGRKGLPFCPREPPYERET
jgi:hypothetical protein